MNPDREDHRLRARAARASGKDDLDPEVAAALEALASDPELLAAWQKERQEDLALSQSLRATEPPAELEERLLATLRETRRNEALAHSSGSRGSRFDRRSWLGIAAVATLAGGLGYLWRRPTKLPIDRLMSQLATFSSQGVTLSLMSMDKDEVVGWLQSNDAPRADKLPAPLDALGRKGCHLYHVEGLPVSLECFLLPGMREIHLFTTASSGLAGAPAAGAPPQITRTSGQTAALWARGEHTLALLTDQPAEEIRKLFGTA